MNILHTNIRSINKNGDELFDFLDLLDTNIDIIALSETWLEGQQITNKMGDYNFYGNENFINRASGVALLVKGDLLPIRIALKSDDICDVVGVMITIKDVKVLIIGLYRPFHAPENQFLDWWDGFLIQIRRNYDNIIIVGDFNFDMGDFNDGYVQSFITSVNSSGFSQSINKITRPKRISDLNYNQEVLNGSIIDLFISNIHFPARHWVFKGGITDHFPTISNIRINDNDSNDKRLVNNIINNFNWNIFKHEIEKVNWDVVINNIDIESSMEGVIKNIQHCKDKANNFTIYKRYKNPRRPWITQGLLNCIKKRDKYKYRLKTRGGGLAFRERVNNYCKILKKVLKNAEKAYYGNKIDKSSNKSKELWKIVKKVGGLSSGIIKEPDFLIEGNEGDSIKGDLNIANNFNSFFVDMGCNGEEININDNMNIKVNPSTIFLRPTSPNEIKNIIGELSNSNARGLDGISNMMLKKVKDIVSNPLSVVFNRCLLEGFFPSILKEGVIKIKFKNGNPNIKENYRPLSMLSSVGKVLEKIFVKRLSQFLHDTNWFGRNQCGFIKGRSSEEALTKTNNIIRTALNEGNYVGAISLDIMKAFDSVNHNLLLRKLNKAGIRGNALDFCKSYLIGRGQRVEIRGIWSERLGVKRGVPQGSILGPLLFIIFMNDLDDIFSDNLDGTLILFADDTLLLCVCKNIVDVQKGVQNLINISCNWFRNNDLRLNGGKSNYVIFMSNWRNRTIKQEALLSNVFIDNVTVKSKKTLNYLGVIFDSYLTWWQHIFHLIHSMSTFVHCFFKIRNIISQHSLLIIYKLLVQSRINYAILLYGLSHKTKMDLLFRFQRKLLRIILFMNKRDPQIYEAMNNLCISTIYHLIMLSIIKEVILSLSGRRRIGYRTLLIRREALSSIRNNNYRFIIPRYYNMYGKGNLGTITGIVANFCHGKGFDLDDLGAWKDCKKFILEKVGRLQWDLIRELLF